MNKYIVCVGSILALLWCKIKYRKSLSLNGLPFRIRAHNIKVRKGGQLKIGKLINITGNTLFSVHKGANIGIGNNVYFNRNCNIVSRGTIRIGDSCRFGPNICIYDHDHKYGLEGVTDDYKTGEVIIGNRCWIGANAVILRGSIIGDGCVIGSGVVFKGNLAPHSLVYMDNQNFVIREIKGNSTQIH